MYKNYFGLQREPFGMTPDPHMLRMTIAQREAMAGIMYAVLARRGFVALIGEAGTGKTTLLNAVMRTLKQNRAQFSVVFNPTLNPHEFLESALADFGFTDIPENKAQRLLALNRLLITADEQRTAAVLIVDEAHKLSSDVLEEIRLLSNFERPEGKLIQIILAGQPQLAAILDRADLEQLKQRVAVRLTIGRFSSAEVQAYIAQRWAAAGGPQHPFSQKAVEVVAMCSHGIPRVVNSICDNALMMAMAEGSTSVTQAHVEEAARDLAFTGETAEPANTPAAVAVAPKQPEDLPVSGPVPTLERYAAKRSRDDSMLSRLLGRFGWVN
jgi:general secretion pathway protein A